MTGFYAIVYAEYAVVAPESPTRKCQIKLALPGEMELPEEVSLQMQFLHSVLLPWVSNPYPNRSKQILDPLHRVFNPFPSIPDPLPY